MSDAPMAKRQDADAGLWWVVLAAGVITSLFAIAIMAWPDITLGILTALLGIELIVAGVLDLVRVFAAKGENAGARWFMGVVGVVALGVKACGVNQELSFVLLAVNSPDTARCDALDPFRDQVYVVTGER